MAGMRHEGYAVVILAGGEGRRMGGGKPSRLLAGRSLIERALALAHRWSDKIAVAIRDPLQIAGIKGATIIIDEGDAGPLEGVRSALRFAFDAELEGVLTIACDIPLAPDDLMDRLAAALRPGVGAAVATSGGTLHPAAALWSSKALDALPAYLASGRSSLRGFAEYVGFVAVEWPTEPYDPFLNINSPEDLAATEALIRGR